MSHSWAQLQAGFWAAGAAASVRTCPSTGEHETAAEGSLPGGCSPPPGEVPRKVTDMEEPRLGQAFTATSHSGVFRVALPPLGPCHRCLCAGCAGASSLGASAEPPHRMETSHGEGGHGLKLRHHSGITLYGQHSVMPAALHGAASDGMGVGVKKGQDPGIVCAGVDIVWCSGCQLCPDPAAEGGCLLEGTCPDPLAGILLLSP